MKEKKQINAFFKEFATQYIPGGYIELFDPQKITKEHMFYGVPTELNCETVEMETKDKHYLFRKISDKSFLQISAEKRTYNAGILKSISKKVVKELFALIKN